MEQNNDDDGVNGSKERQEQEEALVALIEHRTREVQNLRQRVFYYQSQMSVVFESLHGKLLADHMLGKNVHLEDAEKRLRDSESRLARSRGQTNEVSSRSCGDDRAKAVKMERRSKSPVDRNEGSSKNQHQSRPELRIPNTAPKDSQVF